MTGCTFKRVLRSGRVVWGFSLDAGKDENGRRRQIYRSGFARKADADAELTKLLSERSEGALVKPDPRTVAEFFETWLAEYAETSCAGKTAERYREMLAHISRALGQQPLSKLTTLQLQRVYNELLKSLAIKTVRNVHGAVHVALETAVVWGLLRANPASRCKLPPAPKREAVALDFSAVRHLLECSAEHWLADFLVIDAACGARRGEALALSWRDVTPDYTSITIARSLEQTKAGLRLKETKGRNIRTVPLPKTAIEALKRIRVRYEERRAMFAGDYDAASLDLVFCQPDGNFIRPDTVTKAVRRLAKKAGFARVSLHTIRHSFGSQLLSAAVPLPVVSKLLGHTDVYTTARVYAHALESDESAAIAKWEAAMKASRSKVRVMPNRKQA